MFQKLKEIRTFEGLTQEEIAKRLNVKRSTYAGWESGKDIIPLGKLNEFANIFHVTLDSLVGTCELEHTDFESQLDPEIIANNLKAFRKEKNLTQEQLADILKTSQANIHKYENGKCLITTTYALEFSKQYKYSLDKLVGRKKNN